MKILMQKMLILIFLTSTGVCAEPEFIIMPNKKNSVSGSKNSLKEKLGQSTKKAINFTTELGTLIGRVKIDVADNAEKMCKISQLSQMQKNDGNIQINLSSIQSNFSDLIEHLIDNRGFFKKASRSDLSGLVGQMNDICKMLQSQVQKFEQLGSLGKTKDRLELVFGQFDVSAKELKDIQEKVKDLRCLKKS